MKFFDRYQGWLHLIGWAIFVGLPFLTLPDFLYNQQDLRSIGMAQLLTSTLIILFFYVNLRSLTPALLQQQRSGQFLGVLVLMLASVCFMRWVAFQVWPPARLFPPAHDPISAGHAGGPSHQSWQPEAWTGILGSGISFGFAMLVSSLMALFRYHTRSQAAQQQMSLEKVSAELAMLKLQVSPHFLFNTLNNIRWLARKKSDQTEAAVVTLAQLLRYMIYQARQDKVPLRQEVQHLQDYIDLQTMRLTSQHTVTFACAGDIDAYQIEPLLFIPFVENAFKYGLHSQQPGQIRIGLRVADHTLSFSTENPTGTVVTDDVPARTATTLAQAGGTDGSEPASGIGVLNVQKRLALHYPNRHELNLTADNGMFRVDLTLDLAQP